MLLLISIGSCKLSNKVDKESLHSFFSKTNWIDFNKKTLIENNQVHYLDDKIDFYGRKDFFEFMKKSNYNIMYDDFYLVEIVNLRTERTMSKKIIAINCDGEITYLFFKNSMECEANQNFSDSQINKYRYEKLRNGTNREDDDYIMVTKVIGDKY